MATAERMLASAQRKSAFKAWTAAFIAGIIFLSGAAAIVGYLVFSEVTRMDKPDDDPEWIIFQLGYEHQRLLNAVETGKTDQEVVLRGDIYLSRVFILRGARILGPVRESMLSDRLNQLFASAQEVEALLQNIGSPEGRGALLEQLRADSVPMNELMIQMSTVNRQIASERRAQYKWNLLYYLGALELLLLLLLGMGMGLFHVTRKLREARDDLEEQFSTQTAILKSIDEVILGVGPGGTVLYSNPSAAALLGPGARAGSVLGQLEGAGSGLVPHIRLLLGDPWERGTGGSFATRKVQVGSEDGGRSYLIRKFLIDRQSAGVADNLEEASIIVTVTDTTNEELAARRRMDYDRRLSEVSQLLAYAAVSGGIVHEISQPLAAISNYIHSLQVALKRRMENEEATIVAEQLHVEVKRAIEVVRNVRRMGPQESLEDNGTCDVSEAISHSVRLVLLGRNPVPPVTVEQPPQQITVSGSLPLIGQVVINLLKNALAASEKGGQLGARISVTLQGNNAAVAIEDFGEGLSEDAAKTLFAPFSKSSRGGMGLGLAICQRIASTIGGSLSWENSSRGGAIFRFIVPVAREGATE